MNNYYYIVSSLPVIDREYKFADNTPESILDEIRSQCSKRDNQVIDFLLEGFNADSLNVDFYRKALSHKNSFIRSWFDFDLKLRNAKVRYLNGQLGRSHEKDVLNINENEDLPVIDCGEFEDAARLDSILSGDDLLTRERELDNLCWDRINMLSVFNYFDLNAILAFICKMQICARWFRLDEQAGRVMFRRLVDEIRGTFKGVEYQG